MGIFSQVPVRVPKRTLMDLGHDVKMSLKFGFLYPCLVMETIPGDSVQIGGECMLRLMPMSAPVMHEMDYTIDYWYVPNRVTWDGWDSWIFQQPGAPAFPTLTMDGSNCETGFLSDYLGLPSFLDGADPEVVSALPFAAYLAIWNEFYRDQNLQNSETWKLINGSNNANAALVALRRRAWQHDYFTSCLPFAQKGGEVSIPIGDITLDINNVSGPPFPRMVNGLGVDSPDGNVQQDQLAGNTNLTTDGVSAAVYDPAGSLVNDAVEISAIRKALKLQEWKEMAARVGTRVKEGLKGFFNVKTQDARLDLPEFITSVKARVNVSEVLNNTGTPDAPQGSMAGHGIAYNKGRYGKYYCPEHGYIIGVMSVRPKTAYQQGIEKHWLKTADPYDYFWHQFEHIGEQAVLNKEIYAFQNEAGLGTFGYIPRYAEYKFMNSRVAGDFKSTLNDWHLGRIFAEPPVLDDEFIECQPDANRIFAGGDADDYLLANIRHHIMMVRGMSKFGEPRI